jgi:hypothetical protein
MPLFGKNSVQEAEAAKRFLQELNSDIFSNWPAICQVFSDSAALEPGKPTLSKCSENKAAAFEFYLEVKRGQAQLCTKKMA